MFGKWIFEHNEARVCIEMQLFAALLISTKSFPCKGVKKHGLARVFEIGKVVAITDYIAPRLSVEFVVKPKSETMRFI